MATQGDWRKNKDDEMPLDGIGGVNIMVKADVHRSGSTCYMFICPTILGLTSIQALISHAMLSKTRPKPKDLPRWQNEPATVSMDFQTTLSGT